MSKLVELFGRGYTQQQAADAVGMKVRTLKSWLAKYPEFKAAVEEVKELMVDEALTTLYKCAMKAEHDPRYQSSLFRFLAFKVPQFQETSVRLIYKEA